MSFKIWLENMESAKDIFQRLSSLIISAPTYQAAIKSLSDEGMISNFDTNNHSGLGHKWSDVFYTHIAGGAGKENKELDEKLDTLNSKIVSLGFPSLPSPEPWYYFKVPDYEPDDANKKIHVKIPAEKVGLTLELAKIIKQNIKYVRQFKFAVFGKQFEARRDNFVIYLTKEGEKNVDYFRKIIASIGLSTDIGEDFKGSKNNLSQTQLVSLRLAAILVNKSGSPPPKSAFSSHWPTTEKEFLLSDPIGSRYLNGETTEKAEVPAASASQSYQPKKLVLSGKGRPINININTQIGKNSLEQSIGDDAKYFSDNQFAVKKASDGWYLIPSTSAINQTIVNGSTISGPKKIQLRDQIGIVGKSGKQVMPLTVTSV